MSLLRTLTLGGQRRRVDALAAEATLRSQDALRYRRDAWSAIEARAKRRESLLLAFVTGVVIARLVPRQRRDAPTGPSSSSSPPLLQNPALHKMLSMAGTLALSRLVRNIGDTRHP